MTSLSEFRLIDDSLPVEGHEPLPPHLARTTLCVPSGVSHLYLNSAGILQLSTAPAESANAYVLEPQFSTTPPSLLVVAPTRGMMRVNSYDAPQVALLGEKDVWQVSPQHLLHVTIFHRPKIGPPAERFVGKECPVCCTRFTADTRVYSCFHCGAPVHLQGAETPAEKRLECSLAISVCPVCRNPIELKEGSSYQPELYHA